MRKLIVDIYITLGFLALCVGIYIDVSYPFLLICAFWVACNSFYKAYKVDNTAIGVSIIGFLLILASILIKVIPVFA